MVFEYKHIYSELITEELTNYNAGRKVNLKNNRTIHFSCNGTIVHISFHEDYDTVGEVYVDMGASGDQPVIQVAVTKINNWLTKPIGINDLSICIADFADYQVNYRKRYFESGIHSRK